MGEQLIPDGVEIPAGYRAAAVKAGIKPSGSDDLAILLCDHTSAAAGTVAIAKTADGMRSHVSEVETCDQNQSSRE